jgi:putative acetyltransferase
MTDLVLRREHADDRRAIRALTEAAFGRPDEADLIDRLRAEGAVLASFVARYQEEIVGHILFSRMLIETDGTDVPAVTLAPMAACPRFGFAADRARALTSPFPPDAFMALELVPGALERIRGTVRYAKAFGL